jgi:hypothetical protein
MRTVIDVLAVLASIGSGASAHAELRVTDETGPFMVLKVSSKGVAIYKTTNRVAVAVCKNFIPVNKLLHPSREAYLPAPWGSNSNGHN